MLDHSLGRFMNHNFAEYHVPVNADVYDIDVIFVSEHEDKRQPARASRAWARSASSARRRPSAMPIYHATGKRIREYPITLDKLLG